MRLKMPKPNTNLLRSRRQSLLAFSGPGREGPAFADFCIEPQLLDFWGLEKSFARTRLPRFIRFLGRARRAIKTAHQSAARPLSPRQKYVCLTLVALFVIPSITSFQSVRENVLSRFSTRCAYQLRRVLLIIAVAYTAKRRHSRSQSPEIPGRISFFVIATGRSPPAVDRVPPGQPPTR